MVKVRVRVRVRVRVSVGVSVGVRVNLHSISRGRALPVLYTSQNSGSVHGCGEGCDYGYSPGCGSG